MSKPQTTPEIWRTVQEHAAHYGKSTRQVTRLIAAGRLQTNGKHGQKLRVRGKLANWHAVDGAEEAEPLSAYDAAKQEKTVALAKLAKIQVAQHEPQARREYVERLMACFTSAFSNCMKDALAALELPQEKAAPLESCFSSCMENFQAEVEKWLNGENPNVKGEQ